MWVMPSKGTNMFLLYARPGLGTYLDYANPLREV